jgi:hypothetical protein
VTTREKGIKREKRKQKWYWEKEKNAREKRKRKKYIEGENTTKQTNKPKNANKKHPENGGRQNL